MTARNSKSRRNVCLSQKTDMNRKSHGKKVNARICICTPMETKTNKVDKGRIKSLQ